MRQFWDGKYPRQCQKTLSFDDKTAIVYSSSHFCLTVQRIINSNQVCFEFSSKNNFSSNRILEQQIMDFKLSHVLQHKTSEVWRREIKSNKTQFGRNFYT